MSSSHSPRRSSRPPVGAVAALLTVGALALALWGATLWHLGTTGGAMLTQPQANGAVVSCAGSPQPGCSVRYTTPEGSVQTRILDRPGLIGVGPGENVPVTIADDGSIGVAGWRAWTDGLILLVLAIAVTSGAFRWLERVLRAGDELTTFDLDEGYGRGMYRHRDAG